MKRKRAAFVALAVVVLAVAWTTFRVFEPPTRFSPGKDMSMDDFTFSVTGASPAGMSGAARLYAVKIRVRNHARRVDYTFKPEEVAAFGADGEPLEYVGSSCWGSNTLHPNEEQNFVLMFKGSPKVKSLKVRFTFGGPLGTVLESVFFGRKVFDVDIRPEGRAGDPPNSADLSG